MNTKLIMFLGALVLMCGLASCSSGKEPDMVTKQSINQCFTLYKNTASGTFTAGSETGYTIQINYTTQTCDITITGLALPGGQSYPAIELTNLPFRLPAEDFLTVDVVMSQSSINGFSSAPVFNNIKCGLRHRMIDTVYAPAFLLQFNVEGYDVVSSIPDIFMTGETVSTGPDGVPYSTNETAYHIKLDKTLNKATISLSGAHFISAMPALDIEFPDVAASFEGGTLVLKSDALTPTLMGTPNPGFPITNLSGTIDITGLSTIAFDCTPRTMEGKFHVVATIDPVGYRSK